MNCHELEALKHAYVDLELDIVHGAEIERHLAECPACARAYENLRALSSALKSANLFSPAPADLRKRVRTSLLAQDHGVPGSERPKRARSKSSILPSWQHWLKWAIPLAGTALVAFLLAALLIGPSGDTRLAGEITASHVRSLMANHLTDVASSDQHTVKPWFDGKLDFAPPVKDLAADGFPLTGGRLDYLQGRSVAALVYQRQKHVINLFIWPVTRTSDRSNLKFSVRQGYHLIEWNDSGMSFCAVSDLNPSELHKFAELITK